MGSPPPKVNSAANSAAASPVRERPSLNEESTAKKLNPEIGEKPGSSMARNFKPSHNYLHS